MKKIVLAGPLLVATGTVIGAWGIGTPGIGAKGETRVNLTPHETVLSTVQALRSNDTEALVRSLLTDEQWREARADWDQQRKGPVDPAEAQAFEETMSRLTAPGAEEELMKEIEPALAEMRPQMTMMVGMFSGMGQAILAENDALAPAEKQKAARLLDAVGRTLLTNDLTDAGAARKAVGIVCKAARDLKVKTLAEVQALGFEGVLAKGDVVLRATKEVLAVYGISLDDWLATFKAETIQQEGDTATVRVHFEILGVSDSTDYEMVKVGGRWVQKEAAEASSTGF